MTQQIFFCLISSTSPSCPAAMTQILSEERSPVTAERRSWGEALQVDLTCLSQPELSVREDAKTRQQRWSLQTSGQGGGGGGRRTLTSAKKPTKTEREQCSVVAQLNWGLKRDGYSVVGGKERAEENWGIRIAKSGYKTRQPIRIPFNSKITSNQEWILLYII